MSFANEGVDCGPEFLGRDQGPLVTDLYCFLIPQILIPAFRPALRRRIYNGRERESCPLGAVATEPMNIHSWHHQVCRLFRLGRLVTVTQQEEL